MTTALPDNDDLLAEVVAASGGGMRKVNTLPDLCNMKASLALAESLARASLMTSPAAKRRLQARRLELGLGELPGYVPPKHLLLYLVSDPRDKSSSDANRLVDI
ncbi:hypothetical protein LSTR_LSTR013670 [Laodelphax striatellus]|uniref:Uncharacterized protein n=1 Tax=Laodelphax striatellus TaxID=195883 RepID=A0A482WRL2_LAOST|nr:hypothetical protein LSTR_LSTR013670 [Laodelphax striatellus]